jgi:PAS domain S-box-containing protein
MVGGSVVTGVVGLSLFAHLDALELVAASELSFFALTAGSTGSGAGLIVAWFDVRSRRRGREIDDSERQFRAVFEGTLDALVLADDDGRYVAANPAAADLFGVPQTALLGKRISDFTGPDVDFDASWAAFQEHDGQRGVFQIQRPDGQTRTVEFAATRNVLPDTHLSALRDVTERERSQRQAADQHEQLSFLNRMLRHHVRNNLQVVVAEAEQLDAAGDASAGVLLDRIDAIETVLDRVGQFTSSLTRDEPLCTVAVTDVVADAVEIVTVADPGIDVTIEEVPEMGVVADGLLSDVFVNLLSNGVQHNDADTPRLRVSGVADEETITVTIADNGPGIDDDRKERIFEWTDGAANDLGFGLYLTKALVARYGGRVWVEDAPELGGAAFSVELRRDLYDALAAEADPVASTL